MKKSLFTKLAVFFCICAAAFSLAACGGNSQPAETPAEQGTPAGSSAVTPAGSSAVAPTVPESDDSSEYADYTGYQFSGTDPWGGELAITIRSIKDDTMELTYTDMVSKDLTLYAECGMIPVSSDKTAPLEVTGEADDMDNVSFKYVGTIALKDGQLEFTFEEGSVTSTSDQGDSDSYQVGPLTDDEKTVILTKTVDPS